MSDYEAKSAMLVVSTASSYKFAGDVLLSITGSKPENDLFAPQMLRECTGVDIPLPLEKILSKTPIHNKVIDKERMADAVLGFALK